MNSFPIKLESPPQEMQLAKELWEQLGCKDPLTRVFIRATFVAIKVFDFKQQNYGTGNIARAGWRGVVTRLGDKVSRLENLMAKAAEPDTETIEDTLGDSGVYGIIGYMCRLGMWPGVPAARPE